MIHLSTGWHIYFWVTFAVMLVACWMAPNPKQNAGGDFFGSILVSLFGPILWPFGLALIVKLYRNQNSKEGATV